MIAGLPRDCALLRKLDPERSQWDNTAELLAALIEVVDFGNRLAWVGHRIKGSPPEPVLIRPRARADKGSTTAEKRRMATAAEMKAFFGGAVEYVPGG